MNDEATHTCHTWRAGHAGLRKREACRRRMAGTAGASVALVEPGSRPCRGVLCAGGARPSESRPSRIARGLPAWRVRSLQCTCFCSEVYRRASERDSLHHEENGGKWPSPGASPQTLCPQQGCVAAQPEELRGQRSSNGNPVWVSRRVKAALLSVSGPHNVNANADGWGGA